MDYISQFKNYLYTQQPRASVVTVKNYSADVRKFLKWLNTHRSDSFTLKNVTKSDIESFHEYLHKELSLSQRSTERYFSSLRKFFLYLHSHGELESNPFSQPPITKPSIDTKWRLHEFKEYLLIQKVSSLTIKNYVNDIRQFSVWWRTNVDVMNSASLPDQIQAHIEEYKLYLLQGDGFSPLSINRKLSSLRKYLRWYHSIEEQTKDLTIKNIAKEFYAPGQISLTHLPFHKRTWHHLRNYQPKWIESYHSDPIDNHLYRLGFLSLIIAISFIIAENSIIIQSTKIQENLVTSLQKNSAPLQHSSTQYATDFPEENTVVPNITNNSKTGNNIALHVVTTDEENKNLGRVIDKSAKFFIINSGEFLSEISIPETIAWTKTQQIFFALRPDNGKIGVFSSLLLRNRSLTKDVLLSEKQTHNNTFYQRTSIQEPTLIVMENDSSSYIILPTNPTLVRQNFVSTTEETMTENEQDALETSIHIQETKIEMHQKTLMNDQMNATLSLLKAKGLKMQSIPASLFTLVFNRTNNTTIPNSNSTSYCNETENRENQIVNDCPDNMTTYTIINTADGIQSFPIEIREGEIKNL